MRPRASTPFKGEIVCDAAVLGGAALLLLGTWGIHWTIPVILIALGMIALGVCGIFAGMKPPLRSAPLVSLGPEADTGNCDEDDDEDLAEED